MKRITMILGMVAIAASTLFVSCAKKHEPVHVTAFPRERAATYALNQKGEYAWSTTSTDKWSSADNRYTGFRTDYRPTELADNEILFYMAPNSSWTATISGVSKNYIKFRTYTGGEGFYNPEKHPTTYEVSGERGTQEELCIVVTQTPDFGEDPFVAHIYLTMDGQTMPLANITIGPKAEEVEEDVEE